MFAACLIVLVICHGFKVQGARVIKGMIGDRPLFGGRGFADKGGSEVGNLSKLSELPFECCALLGVEIFLQPEIDVVNNHRVGIERGIHYRIEAHG